MYLQLSKACTVDRRQPAVSVLSGSVSFITARSCLGGPVDFLQVWSKRSTSHVRAVDRELTLYPP